ncbi:MAG TPA: alpha/beta hydrolase [Gemmatimonadaceae bacterium]|nr:alpha/beta hydrolase [Gemmatimonadaceae bacterium]
MCAARAGLPPLLVVQAGPGFPLLHEVKKFQRQLRLENDFLVCYWDQRGCGPASKLDANSVSMQQQVDDLRAVLAWIHAETRQQVIVFGISVGATFVLQAVQHETDKTKAVVAISADSNTARSDASVHAFLREQVTRANDRRLSSKFAKLATPPYTGSAEFQQRASILADLGGIERGKKFSSVLRETLFGMLGTYGVVGTAKAVGNMNAIQNALLPQMVSLDLFADPPRLAVPVHYVFGEQDPLVPAELAKQLPAAIAAPACTVTLVPNAAHMVHFDQPAVVRSVVMNARS